MDNFNELPKTLKKTIRYILQDVNSIEKIGEIEEMIKYYLEIRKKQLTEQ